MKKTRTGRHRLTGRCRVCGGDIEVGECISQVVPVSEAWPTARDRQTARANPGAVRGPYACADCIEALETPPPGQDSTY